jgi:hypothetical protein
MDHPLKLCAYNQTVQRLLGFDITAAEFSDASLKEWMLTLTPRSDAGLWIVPFRGIPESYVRFPLDLVYLDEDRRVVDLVESFPASRVSISSPSATSVLILPAHSIRSSRTKSGDQLDIDVPEEMERKRKRTSNSSGVAGTKTHSDRPMTERSDAIAGLASAKASLIDEAPTSQPETSVPVSKTEKSLMDRMEDWWNHGISRDDRKAPREPSPPLIAHFWTGAAPEAHTIRDISASGLYVVTKERWYLGTTIRVILTKSDKRDLSSERSICVHSRAVRWGNDGVGLQFVLKDKVETRRGEAALEDGADRKELDLFLKRPSTFGQSTQPILVSTAKNRTKDLRNCA